MKEVKKMMGFESAWITNQEDKGLFNKVVADNFGNVYPYPEVWVANKEKEIILFATNNESEENPYNYVLLIDDEVICLEAYCINMGNRLKNALKIHWRICNIDIPEELYKKGYDKDIIKNYIMNAFAVYGHIGIKQEQIKEDVIKFEMEGWKDEKKSDLNSNSISTYTYRRKAPAPFNLKDYINWKFYTIFGVMVILSEYISYKNNLEHFDTMQTRRVLCFLGVTIYFFIHDFIKRRKK